MKELNDAQKEVVEELNTAMHNLFIIFVKIDAAGMAITDALEECGMEVPLFARPAVNQLSSRFGEMRKAVNSQKD